MYDQLHEIAVDALTSLDYLRVSHIDWNKAETAHSTLRALFRKVRKADFEGMSFYGEREALGFLAHGLLVEEMCVEDISIQHLATELEDLSRVPPPNLAVLRYMSGDYSESFLKWVATSPALSNVEFHHFSAHRALAVVSVIRELGQTLEKLSISFYGTYRTIESGMRMFLCLIFYRCIGTEMCPA